MLDFFIDVVIVPSLALLIPLGLFLYRVIKFDLELTVGISELIKLLLSWLGISLIIFLLLSYMSGDLNYYAFLEPGFSVYSSGFQLNFTSHLGLTFRYDPGMLLLVVSMLSGILYAALWVLPPVCTVVPSNAENNFSNTPQDVNDESTQESGPNYQGGDNKTYSAYTGGFSGVVSAVASTAVCCSTSVAAVLAPTIATFLGPVIPFMFYLSIIILIYSFVSIVLPRFPVI